MSIKVSVGWVAEEEGPARARRRRSSVPELELAEDDLEARPQGFLLSQSADEGDEDQVSCWAW